MPKLLARLMYTLRPGALRTKAASPDSVEPPEQNTPAARYRQRLGKQLDDAVKARDRHLARHQSEAEQRLKRAMELQHPGSYSTTWAGLSAGLATGLPFADIGAKGSLSVARAHGVETFSTLEVASSQTTTATASLGLGMSTLGGVVDISANVPLSRSWTNASASDSPQHYALVETERVLHAARQRMRPLDRIRSWFGLAPRRHDVDAQDRLDRLLTHPLVGELRPDLLNDDQPSPRQPPALPAVGVSMTSKTLAGQVGPALFGEALALALNTSHNHTDVKLDVPVWLPGASLSALDAERLIPAMEQRLRNSLQTADAAPPAGKAARHALGLFARGRGVPVAEQDLLRGGALLDTEYRHLEVLLCARTESIDGEQVNRILASVYRDWNSTTLRDTLTRMHQTGETLLLALDQGSNNKSEDPLHQQKRKELCTLLANIRDRFGREFGPEAMLDLHASRSAEQHFQSTTFGLGIQAGAMGLGANVSASVTYGHQQMYDPQRDGKFLEIKLTGDVVADTGPLVAAVGSKLSELQPQDLAGIQQGLAMAQGGLNEGVTTTARFFEPSYARQDGVDPRLAGLKLEHIRYQYTKQTRVGFTASIPTAPGLNTSVGASAASARAEALLPDTFGTEFIGGSVVRYLSMAGQTLQADDAWKRMTGTHGQHLLQVAAKLQEPDSVSQAHAVYWMGRAAGNGGSPATGRERLQALKDACDGQPTPLKTDDPRAKHVLEALKAIFDEIGRGVARDQASSRYMGQVALRGSPGSSEPARGLSR